MNATDLINLREVARRLSVSRRTVERRIAEGQIAPTKVGKRTLISEFELNRFVRNQTRTVR